MLKTELLYFFLSSFLVSPSQAVQQVLANMLIAHVELRDEESPDIRPYQHERKVEKIVVKLGPELTSIRDKYFKVFYYHITCYI